MTSPETASALPSGRSSKAWRWGLGCAAAGMATLLVCGFGSWFLWRFAVQAAGDLAYDHLRTLIAESELPEPQVDSMLADLDRAKRAYDAGTLEFERLSDLEDELERILALGTVRYFETQVLPTVELSEEEQAEGERTLQRLARGIQEGTIDEDPGLEPLNVNVDPGREPAWDAEDVRIALAKIRRAVDAAGVPDEPYTMDLASDFGVLIDELVR